MKNNNQKSVINTPFFLALIFTLLLAPVLHAELPVACGSGNCTPAGGPDAWVTNGSASLSGTANSMTIHQHTDNATLNWETFNIGNGNTVNFSQPDAGSTALNRVWDASANPSNILGNLNANGRVFLINRNGILFGPNSRVNVHTLIGSTLDVNDQIFAGGITSALENTGSGAIDVNNDGETNNDQAYFTAGSTLTDYDGGLHVQTVVVDNQGAEVRFATNDEGIPVRFAVDDSGSPVTDAGGNYIPDEQGRYIPDSDGETLDVSIAVREGAVIETQNGGRIALFSPQVVNEGFLHSPDGQTILAAGQEVYMVTDPDLRGLLVEVNTGGDVTNLGTILAEHGNITLAGLSVNQSGRVTATTSVNLNGTIRLVARDTVENVNLESLDQVFTVNNAGEVVFGADSVTEVTLDDNGETAVRDQDQLHSVIDVMGQSIHLQENSQLLATGGSINFTAIADPSAIQDVTDIVPSLRDDSVAIQIDAGSRIDVSGAHAQLEMSRNELEVDIRSNELRDSPEQRDGPLDGSTVTIDIRRGTDAFDTTGAMATIREDVNERSAEGGTVSIISHGSINFAEGAEIDVSGGSVSYEAGIVHTTQLLQNGSVVDISNASANEHYDGILGSNSRVSERWGVIENGNMSSLGGGTYYEAYTDGTDAGSVQFSGYQLAIDGSLVAETTPGVNQRDLANRPVGGQLTIGTPGGFGLTDPNYMSPNIVIIDESVQRSAGEYLDLINTFGDEDVLYLSSGYLNDSNIDNAFIYSNGRIVLAENTPLNMNAGSNLHLEGRIIDIQSDISIPSGAVETVVRRTHSDVPISMPIDTDGNRLEAATIPLQLTIDDGITINTAGVWTNESEAQPGGVDIDLSSPIALNGGDISIEITSGGSVSIGNNVNLDVSGGLWLQHDNAVEDGAGGRISIDTGITLDGINIGENLEFRGYALEQGGELSISMPSLSIFGDASDTESLAAQQALWQQGQQAISVDNPLLFPAYMFEEGGFSQFTLTAYAGSMNVEDNAVVTPQLQNYVLHDGYSTQASNNSMSSIADIATLGDEFRGSVNLALSHEMLSYLDNPAAELRIGTGSQVVLDPGASISLYSNRQVSIEGIVSAPGGNISVEHEYTSDNVFDPTRTLWLGSEAQLLARGVYVREFSELGLALGEVLDGGSVSLQSTNYIVAADGSLIDVSGTVEELNIGSSPTGSNVVDTQLRQVASNAGTISLEMTDGLLFEGDLVGTADGSLFASAGSLQVTLNNRIIAADDPEWARGYPNVDVASINISQHEVSNIPADFAAGDAIDSRDPAANFADNRYLIAGNAYLSVDQIESGGFDNVRLIANNEQSRVVFNSDVNLSVDRSLNINASQIDVTGDYNVTLNASYVSLGAGDRNSITHSAHEGILNVNAGVGLNLVNNSAFNGFSDINLSSEGDIRLIQTARILNDQMVIETPGTLNLTADQVYPTTLSQFLLQSDTLNILPGDSPESPVMSAMGSVTIDSRIINQQGVLRAPQGQIVLGVNDESGNPGTEEIFLAPGSITSVSGNGQSLLVGRIENDTDWVYARDTIADDSRDIFNNEVQRIPERLVELNGQNVNISEGDANQEAAIIDISGNSDILAFEQIPGPGGSDDVLLPLPEPGEDNYTGGSTVENTFAILPTIDNESLPYDSVFFTNWDIDPGDSVTLLQDAQGLQAGEYALLPARYALLPGAYLVTFENGYQDLRTIDNVVLPDGTPVVPAYQSIIGSEDRSSRTTGVSIRPGSYAYQQAEYNITSINEFLPRRIADLEIPALPLPVDAGHLILTGEDVLNIGGTIISESTGRGAELDIAAQYLAIVPELTGEAGVVEITDSQLAALEFESLLLGGVRERSGDNLTIDSRSNSVTIAEGSVLDVPEVMLVARSETPGSADPVITVEQGSQIVATQPGSSAAATEQITISGDSALMRVSNNDQVNVVRNGGRQTAVIDLQLNSLISAGNSIALSASDANLDGDIQLQQGSLSIDASQISLGETPMATAGVTINENMLASLSLDELLLSSSGTIDFYGDVSIGQNQQGELINHLQLDALGIRGFNNTGESVIVASNIQLTNSSDSDTNVPVDPAAGNGQIRFVTQVLESNNNEGAGNIYIGDGDYSIDGYTDVSFETNHEIVFDGEGVLLSGGNITLAASRITANSGADKTISTGSENSLSIISPADATVINLAEVTGLGARLQFEAGSIDIDSNIALPSGILEVHATGDNVIPGSGNVVVGNNATIDLSGRVESFSDLELYTPGGRVSLTSVNGNIDIQGGAVVDVSAATASNGQAGQIEVLSRNGSAVVNGQLLGLAGNAENAGSFSIDTDILGEDSTVNQFSLLNTRLNEGGFNNQRYIHTRTGDITIAATDTVNALNTTIVADGENDQQVSLQVDGTINASGEQGGEIQLYANNDLQLSDSALLLANATIEEGYGGHIGLASASGDIDVGAGAQLNVSGGVNADGGSVHLRVQRAVTNDDVRIANFDIATNVVGSSNTTIEAVQVFEDINSITATLTNQWRTDTDTFMVVADQVKNRFGDSADTSFHLLPGIEVRSSQDCVNTNCDLNLTAAWDLSDWRFWNGDGVNGDPAMMTETGILTLRAAGALNVNTSLSDGFDGVLPTSLIRDDESWSYRLIGGSDLDSAEVLAVLPASESDTGNVNIATNTLVRTGTGDIEIAAANNMNLTDLDSVVYTAGNLAIDLVTIPEDAIANFDFNSSERTNVITANGGDLTIRVGNNINSPLFEDPSIERSQFILDWFRYQEQRDMTFDAGILFEAGLERGWFVDFENFRQNFAAIGGGNVSLEAGGDLNFVAVSVPTMIYHDIENDLVNHYGQGNLSVSARGNIHSGLFFVGDGHASIVTDGAMTAGQVVNDSGQVVRNGLESFLALMGGSVEVQTRGELVHHSVFNPTRLRTIRQVQGGMFTYSDYSSASLVSIAGNVTANIPVSGVVNDVIIDPENTSEPGHPNPDSFLNPSIINDDLSTLFMRYPGNVNMTSFSGDVVIDGASGEGLVLFSTPVSNLRMLADNNINIENQTLQMPQTDPEDIPRVGNITGLGLLNENSLLETYILHLDDPEPIYLVTRRGDINVEEIIFPKPARIIAGRDYNVPFTNLQNNNYSDISLISAGRDIAIGSRVNEILSINGPGDLVVQAGRDIDLGISTGIVSAGNQNYSVLPEQGAGVTVMAGLSSEPDYQGFIQEYFISTNEYLRDIEQFLSERGYDDTSLDAFLALGQLEQQPMILRAFFNELRESGRSALSEGTNDYSRGFHAANVLFPGSDAEDVSDFYQGDLSLFYSKIYTLAGGDINILAPGGMVNAGLANEPANAPEKPASELGIVASDLGSINTFTYGDFQVNQSRVFTLRGGDILMWASAANIDAGRGAKTAISAPPPEIIFDDNGNPTITVSSAIAGSGIRAIETDPELGAGDVDLFAPSGFVDAGDAGIGGFNVNIGAVEVFGAEDIDVGGIAMGVPNTTAGVSVGLSDLGSLSSSVAKDAEESVAANVGASDASDTPLADEALSFLEVVELGIGEETDEPE